MSSVVPGVLVGKVRVVGSGGLRKLHLRQRATTLPRGGSTFTFSKVVASEVWKGLGQALELLGFRVPLGLGRLVPVDGYLGKGKILVRCSTWW